MSVLQIGSEDQLFYEFTAPKSDSAATFVFFNALTGDASMWQNSVAKPLLDSGAGILVYNMRGQANSPYQKGTVLDQSVIVADALQLLDHVKPPKPVFVGLSIGGIFAAWAAEQGAHCSGLVLINTLRRDGPRLRWINDSVVRLAEVGGLELMRDVMSPLIMNENWQADNRQSCLTADDYLPIDANSGSYNLLSSARSTDWNFPYEKLTMPTLVITGLHDRVFRDPNDVDSLYARLPNASRVDMEDAGHMVPIEQPEKLSKELLQLASNL